ncbi:hypothetical protein ACFZBM_39125 [Streptomyces lavendulae]|uniref:Uncharacterized protein n=1 Tax=Streptomyces lavendulae subsp. lavendulae TaxID=58340 RepID=A0A2K8PQG1_STRLA|nr:hypothetical protein [Streptomyces lavendulae]ATZ28964.1 hypothetical protein SLAV_35980 [Streptomyces lavendulae subsp. lavendulae]QUQ58789.1 hypothetical protein SLLC_34155 [Streptomyces lavendulae subsp. lavendulae]
MSTWNGIGTKYLGFSHRRPDGSHHATEWFVISYMPVVPLRRYRLVVGPTEYAPGAVGGSTSTTAYRVLGRSTVRVRDVLATYLIWWVAGPALTLGPFFLMARVAPGAGRGSAFWSGVILIGGLVWIVGLPVLLISRSRRWRGLP